jgi:hypothetical protein
LTALPTTDPSSAIHLFLTGLAIAAAFFGSAPPEIKNRFRLRLDEAIDFNQRVFVASIGIEVFPPQRRRTGAILKT